MSGKGKGRDWKDDGGYARGHYGKLDVTAAEGIATMMGESAGISATAAKRLHLILACVACQDSEGWFETSKRRLAKFADISVDKAGRFLNWLDSSGWVEIENGSAERSRRRFVWVVRNPRKNAPPYEQGVVRNSRNSAPGVVRNSRKNAPPSGAESPEFRTTLHNYNYVTVGDGAYADATAPPPQPPLDENGLPDPELYPDEYAKAIVDQLLAEQEERERRDAMADETTVGGDA